MFLLVQSWMKSPPLRLEAFLPGAVLLLSYLAALSYPLTIGSWQPEPFVIAVALFLTANTARKIAFLDWRAFLAHRIDTIWALGIAMTVVVSLAVGLRFASEAIAAALLSLGQAVIGLVLFDSSGSRDAEYRQRMPVYGVKWGIAGPAILRLSAFSHLIEGLAIALLAMAGQIDAVVLFIALARPVLTKLRYSVTLLIVWDAEDRLAE